MKIKFTNSGISFGSLVKLCSVGYFIGMGILMVLMVGVWSFTKLGEDMPGFLWLMLPVLLALQSLFTAVIVAAGLKLYGKVRKFQVSPYGEDHIKEVSPNEP
jgi:hypothetical protein